MAKSVDPFVRDCKIPPMLMLWVAKFADLFARDSEFPMVLFSLDHGI
jgi:hypothetical protein